MSKSKLQQQGGGGGGSGREEKSDGLEIISIGCLYTGPWDKKYWSSSRGKDRYPYPVGYEARRAYNGSNYKMEILEGSKGPLFTISCCGDGNSCSGQTPEIAWGKFQKKISVWHGKRIKIDGIEFFGFKNQFVQRLLRELVANVNGVGETSLLSTSFCDAASRADHDNQCQDGCRHPDLVTYLARTHVTRKRSERQQVYNPMSASMVGFKRIRPGNPTIITDASNLKQRNCEQFSSLPHSNGHFNKEHDSHRLVKALPGKLQSASVSQVENGHLVAKDCLLLKSGDNSDHLRENVLPVHEESKLASSNVCNITSVFSNPSVVETPLDRMHDTEVEGLSFPMSVDDKAASTLSRGINSVDFYAPDTLDYEPDNIANSAPTSPEKSACCAKDKFIVTDVVMSKELVTEAHQEEDIATSNSNASSERSDFDSVGQDIAKSMMTVLLPQAIPLLKTSTRKIKKFVSPLENKQHATKSHKENNKNAHSFKAQSPAVDHSAVSSIEHAKSIIPDSIDDDQYEDHATNKLILPSQNVEPDHTSFNKDTYSFCSREEFDNPDAKKPSVTLVETSVGKDNSYSGILQSTLIKKPQDGDPHLLEHTSDSMTTSKKVFQKEKQKVVQERVQSVPRKMDMITKAGATETDNLSMTQAPKKFYARKKIPSALSTREESDTLIGRNFGDVCVPETTGTSLNSEGFRITSSDGLGAEARIEGQVHGLCTDRIAIESDPLLDSMTPVLQTKRIFCASEGNGASKKQETISCHNTTSNDKDVQINSEKKIQRNLEINNELQGTFGLIGCYFHPVPISLLLLITKGNEIYVCVLCGLLLDKDRTLFLYKLAIEQPMTGYPNFVGHASVTLPYSTDVFGREIVLESSGLQLTPDGQCLVLLGSIKTPYCREGKIDCLCSKCTSECLDHSSVKIVQVKVGYVELLVKLRTTDSLQCVLVCEPNHVVAAGDSGRLHLWTMDSTWSAATEEFVLPANNYMSPCILELKRIPKCASLVVGHNGTGEFTVWDISKRIFISRFSSQSTTVYQFFPISLFGWKKEVNGLSYSNTEEHIIRLMDATKVWFSEVTENHSYMEFGGEDTAIWLLVSAVSDSDVQQDYPSSNCQKNSLGWWRLGLLVKNMLILGSALDPRAAAIGKSACHGIMGTLDGLLYVWELSTGAKLGNLHHFKGGSVSCIAADDSRSGILAAADDKGQLLIYRRLQHVTN